MSGELFTRVVCPECNNDDRGLGALPCSHCSSGHIYTKVQVATPPGFEMVPEGTMALLKRLVDFFPIAHVHQMDGAFADPLGKRAFQDFQQACASIHELFKETPNAQGAQE